MQTYDYEPHWITKEEWHLRREQDRGDMRAARWREKRRKTHRLLRKARATIQQLRAAAKK